MTSDLARRLDPATFDEARAYAATAVASRMYQIASPEAALMILATGMDLGFSASQSLRAIHVINGKPVISSDALVAAVRNSGKCASWRVVESTAEKCTITTKRQGEDEYETDTFTIEDAKRAGLDRKDVWRAYPKDMLRHRCAAALARRVYPDVVLGMYDPSEFGEAQEPQPVSVEVVKSSKRALTDEEKRDRAAPILAEYDAGIARGENADALHETAKVQAREAGVATFVQQELARRASEDAARKRAAWSAEVLDRLLSALDSADGVPAAIVGAWLDVSDDVRRLDKPAQDHAWAQVESAWTAAGAPSGLREAVAVEKSKRAK